MIVRRTRLAETYDLGRTAGLATAERLVTTLDLPVRRGDLAAVRLLYPLVVEALAAERHRAGNPHA